MSGMVTLIHRIAAFGALRTAWRALRTPRAAFQDIRIIVERDGRLHHFYITAGVQRAAQRAAVGTLGLAGCVVLFSGAMRFQANRVLRANESIYAELLSAAQAEGSMSTDELESLSSGDLAALLRERTGVLRGQVDAAADLLAASNGNWFDSLESVGIPVASDAKNTNGRGGDDVGGARVATSKETTTRMSGEMERSRSLMTTVRRLPDRLPLDGARQTSEYGLRSHPITFTRSLHPGLDLVTDGDQSVHAVRAGRVIFAGRSGGYGNTVVIAHDGGFETRYAHLRSFTVARGDSINEWDILGEVGSTGLSTGPHLHYEIRLLGRPLDPQRILELRANVK
ncbi:MAG: M23 family metallopeptidase [Gemmatimonadaceae bacterium]|nr:M23 family metallopeptidase [Gemmatimonadaceae bacterium]